MRNWGCGRLVKRRSILYCGRRIGRGRRTGMRPRAKSGGEGRDGARQVALQGLFLDTNSYLLRFQWFTWELPLEKRARSMGRFLQGDRRGFVSHRSTDPWHQRIRYRAKEWTRPVILAAGTNKTREAYEGHPTQGRARELPPFRTTRMVAMGDCGHHHASADRGVGFLPSS